MGQEKNNIKQTKGKHLTYENRIKLEALYVEGLSSQEIGARLNKSRRTIERELKRGMVELLNSNLATRKEYSAEVGQQVHDKKATAKGPTLKIGKDHKLVEYIETSIKSGNSPYVTLQNIVNDENLQFKTKISLKTLYNYIDAGLFINISNKDLLVKRNKKKRDYHKIKTAITNKKGTSIVERPIEIDRREEYGHWEMDTVVGKKGTKEVILALSERKSRQELIFKIKSKSQSEVIRIIDELQVKYSKEFSKIFKTITTDNGCEFLDFESIERSLFSEEKRTTMYYAHPYSSWERGTNENINKMIRRFIPKGTDISIYTEKEIERIQNWINNYPRKILDGRSSNMFLKTI